MAYRGGLLKMVDKIVLVPNEIALGVAKRLQFEPFDMDQKVYTKQGAKWGEIRAIDFSKNPLGDCYIRTPDGNRKADGDPELEKFMRERDERLAQEAAKAKKEIKIDDAMVEKVFEEPSKQHAIQEPKTTEAKAKGIRLTGMKETPTGPILIAAPEEVVPKWGISMIKNKKTGKEAPYINMKGLLWLGFQDEVKVSNIDTKCTQEGNVENKQTWIFTAIVTCKRGIFKAEGDCTLRYPDDDAMRRMAETRAIVRALRLATGAGTSAEELPPEYFEN